MLEDTEFVELYVPYSQDNEMSHSLSAGQHPPGQDAASWRNRLPEDHQPWAML